MYKDILENNRAITSLNILVIDDSEISRKITEKFLRDLGFESISFAKDGHEGLKLLQEEKPRLIICDLFMPNMNGYEFIKKVREEEGLSGVPIIVQTSTTKASDINSTYIAGAHDVVLKPLQKEEFLTKVIFHLENSVYRSRVKEELESARKMQESILPDDTLIKNIEKKYKMELASYFAPSSEVGGDFWGVKEVSHSELAIFMADISGHGLPAAFNTFRVKSLIENSNNIFSSPAVFLKKINKKMKKFMPSGQFATMFYGVINIDTNKFRFSGAGCPEPYILRKSGNIEQLNTKGLPLGISKDVEYKETEVDFDEGDLLLTFSDALIETQNDHGEFFSEGKLNKTLSKKAGLSAHKTMEDIHERFKKFISGNEVTDDLTINVYKMR